MKTNGGLCRIRAFGWSRLARWWRRMAQKKYLQAKLTQFLREDRIQLWKPPYTEENKEVGLALKDLAKRYSERLECCENEVENIIEEIRCKAIERGTGNEHYRTTGIATIEVFLPPRLRKDKKSLLETRLHVTGRDLRSKIAETFGFQENYIKIVINKKQLQLGKSLEEQGVTHNVKAMVLELKQSEEDVRRNLQLEEEEQNEAEQKEKRIQRTKRGLEILAERAEMVVDPETMPYLDIANQTGRLPPQVQGPSAAETCQSEDSLGEGILQPSSAAPSSSRSAPLTATLLAFHPVPEGLGLTLSPVFSSASPPVHSSHCPLLKLLSSAVRASLGPRCSASPLESPSAVEHSSKVPAVTMQMVQIP
ncbi:NEDD8 ultimate buster-1, isoform CRA_a [Rattus norvegicus]|uniref:NEDD8 ultimate buster 1 n=1 Tax=Rattus norvegicus TaxID=10116 RepID=A6K528_RAT|nr:NEDD8 ultimate buster-1, isoform CRA_a [Rattus norvegicus]